MEEDAQRVQEPEADEDGCENGVIWGDSRTHSNFGYLDKICIRPIQPAFQHRGMKKKKSMTHQNAEEN